MSNQNSSEIDKATQIELLYKMKYIREVEETIANRYSEQKMRCPTHLCTGQEAVSAAAGAVLRDDDFAVSSHRAHGHYLGKGGNLNQMMAEIYGKATGCSHGKGGSMHLIDQDVGFMGSTAIVGGTIPIGVGLALSAQLKNTDQVSCVFLGDGSVEEGVFYESANFAILRNLPVLFLCENNLFSVYSSLQVRQPKGRKIYEMVEGMGLQTQHGDGNKIEVVYDMIHQAVERIRNGGGPQFLEFETYRWREHCGPNFDNHLGYRTEEEYLLWKERDPILQMEKSLLEKEIISEREIKVMDEKNRILVDEAFKFAEESPFPSQEEAYQHLYK
jgi:TPP-dependent pyruvate/acetoin dehydrogenase alpha subunit